MQHTHVHTHMPTHRNIQVEPSGLSAAPPLRLLPSPSQMTECTIGAMIPSNTIITKHLVLFLNDYTFYLNIYLSQI